MFSPVARSELLASSVRAARASASSAVVSMNFCDAASERAEIASVSSPVRSCTPCSNDCVRSEKPLITPSSPPASACCRLVAIWVNWSLIASVLKFMPVVSRSLAVSIARVVSSLVRSRRSSRSVPRSPSCSIMVSPAVPSATVMCSPFSASERVMRLAASLTRSAMSSLTVVMSWERSRWTLVMALRTCSAWPTSVSRCWARPSSRLRMRTSLSL